METWINLFVEASDPFGWEIGCHAVLDTYYPYRPATRLAPAESGEVEFHLAWKSNGPPSDFLREQCSEKRWGEIHDDLLALCEETRKRRPVAAWARRAMEEQYA